jgi:hypothetical protein
MRRAILVLFAILTSTLPTLGCRKAVGQAAMAEPAPVTGRIFFADRTPLRGGVITFIPLETKDGKRLRYEASSLVDVNGNYKLGFNGNGAGAPPGEYKVVIAPRDYQELPSTNSQRIPPQYQEKDSTPLTVTVNEGENSLDFELR